MIPIDPIFYILKRTIVCAAFHWTYSYGQKRVQVKPFQAVEGKSASQNEGSILGAPLFWETSMYVKGLKSKSLSPYPEVAKSLEHQIKVQ